MGDLELSEVIFSIQNDLYNWGTRDHFLVILALYVVNYTILIEQSKGEYDGEKYFKYFSPLRTQSMILNIYYHPRAGE